MAALASFRLNRLLFGLFLLGTSLAMITTTGPSPQDREFAIFQESKFREALDNVPLGHKEDSARKERFYEAVKRKAIDHNVYGNPNPSLLEVGKIDRTAYHPGYSPTWMDERINGALRYATFQTHNDHINRYPNDMETFEKLTQHEKQLPGHPSNPLRRPRPKKEPEQGGTNKQPMPS